MAIDERNAVRCVGVKRPWSATTRAIKVARVLLRTTLRWRKPNQVVAAGPKMAVEQEDCQQSFSGTDIVRIEAYLHRRAPCDRSWQSHASLDLCGRPAAGQGHPRYQTESIYTAPWSVNADGSRIVGDTYRAGDAGREDRLLRQPCLIPARYLVL